MNTRRDRRAHHRVEQRGVAAARITFGVPVAPLLQMPLLFGDTTSGSSGTGSSAVAVDPRAGRRGRCRPSARSPPSGDRAPSRARPTAPGSAPPPSFHVASTANTNSGEFRMPRRDPVAAGPRRAAASAAASWLERASQLDRTSPTPRCRPSPGARTRSPRRCWPRARGSAGRCSSLRRSLVLLHHGNPGGRRSAQGIAVSSWVASRNSVASSKGRPAHCTPMGSPLALHATGRLSAG